MKYISTRIRRSPLYPTTSGLTSVSQTSGAERSKRIVRSSDRVVDSYISGPDFARLETSTVNPGTRIQLWSRSTCFAAAWIADSAHVSPISTLWCAKCQRFLCPFFATRIAPHPTQVQAQARPAFTSAGACILPSLKPNAVCKVSRNNAPIRFTLARCRAGLGSLLSSGHLA
ncbi:DUF2826 domain-containing protein [Massilia sp. CCM 8693]|uniref:DUF2826 domain-containing protein n=1 Tax=Massilia aquatica TaxID=2609000 RepID=A0ABX0MBM0_9BURK|nr:DUF2826 domain-containing protein [Massilia aquatica]